MSSFEQLAWTFVTHPLGVAELIVGIVVAIALLTLALRGLLLPGPNDAGEAKLS